MALQGTLDTFALPDVLRLLAATRKSGRLLLTGDRGTGSVWVATGEICALEATHAPHATDAVDTLFELLRFDEGSFTFDAEATHDAPGPPDDVESLLERSGALLAEWRDIEAVVPSLDAWVTLRPTLPTPEVAVDQARWTTIVAVGAGATVRRVGDDLCLPELPVSRAIKDLAEAGLLDIAPVAPPTGELPLLDGAVAPARPLVAPKVQVAEVETEAAAPSGPRARRARGMTRPAEPEAFVPLDLPAYDTGDGDGATVEEATIEVDDFASAFPGLVGRASGGSVDAEEEELAKQLATLSPRAASAVRAAAEAGTDEERAAALDAVEDGDQPLNRGLLLKFLSSVKS